ncbi:MAG: LysE family translocator [Chloroflexi bacterium]|nr:MAG: LysE family translocator [Chloroflexota bacterium]
MDFLPLPLRGILIGFAIAAPVGPIGLLCIQRTLAKGWRVGFLSGLGAASADAVYGMIAGLGLTAVSSFLVNQQSWLGLIGGLFLCYLGIKTLLAKGETAVASTQNDQQGIAAAYLSIFALTLTNPITILSFIAIFAGMGLGAEEMGVKTAVFFILGVFTGSAIWWLILSSGASLLRQRLQPAHFHWINRLSGIIILSFGLVALFWQ